MELTKDEIKLLLNWFGYKDFECDIFFDDEYYGEDKKLQEKLKKELDKFPKE